MQVIEARRGRLRCTVVYGFQKLMDQELPLRQSVNGLKSFYAHCFKRF